MPHIRVIFETSPGAPLLVISVPGGASGAQPVSPLGLLFTWQITSQPFPASAGQPFAPVDFVLPPGPLRPVRAWQRDVQRYAINVERERHIQALWQYGELAVFVLLWTTVDYGAGLAVRCPRCFLGTTAAAIADREQTIAQAYGQGNQYLCPVCYNSQFVAADPLTGGTPGIRCLLVRPAVFSDIDRDTQQHTARGVMNPAVINAETTPDFRVRHGDFMFRGSGDRFRLSIPKRVTLRTGFAEPYQAVAAITYNQLAAGLEDPASVAYIIPPDAPTLATWLGTYTRLPVSYHGLEIINGPLIPEESPPPAADSRLQPSVSFPLAIT
jgi:hypothetical protein